MTPAVGAAAEDLAALHHVAMTTGRPWSAAEFAALLASPHVFAVVRPGGLALGRAVADEAELLTLAVHPDQRRSGTGRCVLRGFEEEAVERGAAVAWLEVAATNDPAIALYRAAGWRVTHRRSGYYREPGAAAEDPDAAIDALILRKALT